MKNIKFQKSEILKTLSDFKTSFIIPKFIDIYYHEFLKKNFLKKITQNLNSEFLVIRSSSEDEDGINISNAGKYESILNVGINDDFLIADSIKRVFDSYDNINENSRVLVQEMIVKPEISGVTFTHELETGSPYFVINYDDISKKTDTVTGGSGINSNKSVYVFRNSFKVMRSNRFKNLLISINEIEKLLNFKYLDIEFAIDNRENIYIFQVRPITKINIKSSDNSDDVKITLDKLNGFLKNKFATNERVFGNSTIFGQMPDWNPAEMIGSFPSNLSYSLYSYLITDNVWAIAREQMYYKSLVGFPLMISIAGRPFIDTRLSFSSYLPVELDQSISNKLVDIWINKLRENPNLHDKIEFDVAITCYSFDIEKKLSDDSYNSLSKKEKKMYSNLLKRQLNKIIKKKSSASIENALSKINTLIELQKKYSHLEFRDLKLVADDCKNFGTLPFSILARHGFIAKTLLDSLRNENVIDQIDIDNILNSINTISSEFIKDLNLLSSNKIDINIFIKKYGHLRPGTYDLNSKPYRLMSELFLNHKSEDIKHTKLNIHIDKIQKINKLLKENMIELNFDQLYEYISKAVRGREYAKFIFTKNIDKILSIITDFGKRHGVPEKILTNLKIEEYISLNNIFESDNVSDYINNKSDRNIEKSKIFPIIKLPSLISDKTNLNVIPYQINKPNFITQKQVVGKIVKIENKMNLNIDNKIVLIEGADPGYDWIFSYKIKGLITKFGGANSHMSIRCSEFNIPAAIGCGEILFKRISSMDMIELDCKTKKITL